MPDRMRQQRYLQPELRDRLASEYVLGTLTPKVRQRLESLMEDDPDWWQWVEQWQHHLADLSPPTDLANPSPVSEPPIAVWKNIESAIHPTGQSSQALPWWRNWWMPTGMVLSLLCGIMLGPLVFQTNHPTQIAAVKPVAYLAMMSSDHDPNLFALTAYQGDRPGQSSIRMQQNLGMANVPIGKAMVWMRDKDTGELRLLDSLSRISQVRYLSPEEWGALKNSAELLVTANVDPNSPVLYRGRCLELSGWKSMPRT